MKIGQVLLLILFISLSACRKDEVFDPVISDPEIPNTENVDENVIGGTVSDDSGRPIQDIDVLLYADQVLVDETNSNENGQFFFITEEPKDYLLHFSSSEFQDVISVANPEERPVDLSILLNESDENTGQWNFSSYQFIEAYGLILDYDNNPIVGATIEFFELGGPFSNYTTTDINGKYKVIIPRNKLLHLYIEGSCEISYHDLIISDTDIELDNIFVDYNNDSVNINGSVTNCNGIDIMDGEVTFFVQTQFFNQEIEFTTSVTNGQYSVQLENICDDYVSYIATDFTTGDQVFGEVLVSGTSTVPLVLEICSGIELDNSIINLNIDGDTISLRKHIGFESDEYIQIFTFENATGQIVISFESPGNIGMATVADLYIDLEDSFYYRTEDPLSISITNYPQNNLGILEGNVEGVISNSDGQLVDFTLELHIPLIRI